MAIDPNIALQIGQNVPQINPLGMATQAQGLLNAQQSNKLLGVQTQQAQSNLGDSRNKWIAQQVLSIIPIAAKDPKAGMDAVRSATARGVATGIITQNDADKAEKWLMQTAHHGDLVFGLHNMAINALGIPQQAQALTGTPGVQNVGDTLQPVTTPSDFQRLRTPGMPTMAPSGGGLATTLDPASKAQPVPVVGPNNVQGAVPLGSTVDRFGNAIPGNGSYPGGVGGASTTAPDQPTGFRQTGAQPGSNEGTLANQGAYRTAQADIPQAQFRLQGLDKAKTALELAITGKGTDGLQKIQSWMTSLGLAPDFIQQNTKNYDIAHKYLMDYVNRQVQGSTNEQLKQAIGSNASTDISNKAALDVVKTNIGRERMDVAATMAHPDESGAGFLKHKSEFYLANDPVAFAADQYTPAELKAHVASLGKEGQQKFYKSLARARDMKMINVGQ